MIPDGMKGLFQGLSTAKVRRSALSPISQLCLYVTVPCILSLAIIPEKLQIYVFFLATIPLALFVVVSIYLLLFDRDRLHTEEFLEKKQAMEIVESKSQGLMVKEVDLVNIINPDPSPKALSSEIEEGK